MLTLDFVWISLCLWRGSEALAIRALWRLPCLGGVCVCGGDVWDTADVPMGRQGPVEAARGRRITVRGDASALRNWFTSNASMKGRSHLYRAHLGNLKT